MIKSITKLGILIVLAIIALSSCKGIYENMDTYEGEQIYPARFDTITGKIGYERVEIDLMKAGRISTDEIYMGKAKKTIVEYDDVKIVIDSVVSWVNIPKLTSPKLYRFKVYTEDEHGNKSVPQVIGLVPYTANELKSLAVASPRIFASPNTAVLDWVGNLSSILLNYISLTYSYVDNTGEIRTGEREREPRIFAVNLTTGDEVKMNVLYKVVPKVNGVPILDSVELEQPVVFNMPSATTPFQPAEGEILRANGVSVFNANGVADIRKLVFPIHTKSLQDLFYFSNLEEIDLTGGNVFKMNQATYSRNGISTTIGGVDFLPFVRRMDNMPDVNASFLVDLLENKLVKKVKYIPYSLGIDHLLTTYVEEGVVELVNTPEEVLMPTQGFLINGKIENNAWNVDMDLTPASYPKGDDLENVFKVTLRDRASSFIYQLPVDYQYNYGEYPYLKFKVYAPNKSFFEGTYHANFRRLWPRFMNRLWAYPNEVPYGQELWQLGQNDNRLADADLENWKDITIDLSNMQGKHNRVIVINIGGEPSGSYIAPPKPIVYHFASFRFSKSK